jgi:hypothetical protein
VAIVGQASGKWGAIVKLLRARMSYVSSYRRRGKKCKKENKKSVQRTQVAGK